MNLYPLLLFLHVSAAIFLFIGTGIWAAGILLIGRVARVEHIRTLTMLLLMVRIIVPASALLVIVAGGAMTQLAWSFRTPWIIVTLASLLLAGPFGTWVIDPRVRRLGHLARSLPDGPLTVTLATSTRDPLLRVGLPLQMTILFGIVFLMTVKPTLITAIFAMVVALLLGLLLGTLSTRIAPAHHSTQADTRLEGRQ